MRLSKYQVSYGNFVHKKIIVNIHIPILFFFMFFLFQSDCHMLSQDKPKNERSYFNHKKLTD